MEAVNYAELAELAGEFLPERTVLGTVTTPFNNFDPGQGAGGVLGGGTDGSSSSSAAASGGQGGAVGVLNPAHYGFQSSDACSQNETPLSNSGLLGLFTSAQENTNSCIPATTSGSY
jgi:hypothetical protein